VRCGQGTGENDSLERKFPAAEYFFRKLVVSQQVKKFSTFMATGCSLPCSHQAVTEHCGRQISETCFFLILVHYHFTVHLFRVNTHPPFLKVTSLQTIIVQRHNIFTFSSLNTHRTENRYVRHLYNFNSSTFLQGNRF
jgi:hypothetical protein